PDADSEKQRHPHYGRFLKIIPVQLVQLAWVTGEGGTNGADTVVTVEFIPQGEKTLLKLTHVGFPDEVRCRISEKRDMIPLFAMFVSGITRYEYSTQSNENIQYNIFNIIHTHQF